MPSETKLKHIEIEPTEIIADHIAAIAEGMRKMRAGRLNDRALVLLIQHAAPFKVSIADVKSVLEGIDRLEAEYLRKKVMTTQVIYHGYREHGKAKVTIKTGNRYRPLPWRLKLFNHSPTGFEWGYGGSGPAQCALALLAHVLKDDERAVRLHQRFKFRVVGRLPHDGWTLTTNDILCHVDLIEAERELRENLREGNRQC